MSTRLLNQKVALITGAGRGIGRAIAEVFAENGACVALTDTHDEIEQIAESLNLQEPRRATGFQLNIACVNQVTQAVNRTVDTFGHLDILVNNAGIHIPHPFLEFPFSDFEAVFRVNVFGTFLCAQAAARQMIEQGSGGSIINMASASAKKADPQGAAYNASKSAIVGLTRVMALELGKYNIRVNAILPGATDTEMLRGLFADVPGLKEQLEERTPLGKIASPRDQAHAALFLASDLASHITGEQLVVSGGEYMES
jgi:NAD(P)-dependent dehydrogenase (short-subunit alcohol dehydrogenase family)